MFARLEALVRVQQVHKHNDLYCKDPDAQFGARCRDGYPAALSQECGIQEANGDADRPGPRQFIYRRTQDEDRMIIPYHPLMLLLWRTQMHLAACTEEMAAAYLCKYLSKTEPVWDANVIRTPENEAFLKSEAGQHIYGRIVGAPELSARNLGIPHVEMSRQVFFLDTDMNNVRHRVAKRRDVLEAMNPDDPDVYWDGKPEKYWVRPSGEAFEALKYPEYFERFRVLTAAEAQRRKSSDGCAVDGCGRLVVLRRRAAITRHRFLTPHQHGDAYYFQICMLKVPHRSSAELLSKDNMSGTYKEECLRLKLFGDRTEEDWLRQTAIDRHFSRRAVRRIMADYKDMTTGGQRREQDSTLR